VSGAEVVNRHRERVRYADVDRMGFAYYGNYLRWFEIGRTEYLRALGMSYREVEDSGVIYPVTETYVKYSAPARYDEEIEIATSLGWVKRASLRFDYEILGTDGVLRAAGWTVHAALDRSGRPVRISAQLSRLLSGVGGPADE
jgi:acyl-CoA thioester hydrolase